VVDLPAKERTGKTRLQRVQSPVVIFKPDFMVSMPAPDTFGMALDFDRIKHKVEH
jgi:hypothetical protein